MSEIQENDLCRCVCCGRPVPEGRMVCYACEKGGETDAAFDLAEKRRRLQQFAKAAPLSAPVFPQTDEADA